MKINKLTLKEQFYWSLAMKISVTIKMQIPLHREGAYNYLLDAYDGEMLKWVKLFNPYDLHSKSPAPPDWSKLKGYYEDFVGKYLPGTIKF